MTDTLQSRVRRLLSASAHAVLDHLEDRAPEAVMGQSIRDIETVATEVREALATLASNRHLTQQQHKRLSEELARLEDQSQTAAGAGRDDLARVAIDRILDIEAQLPTLTAALADYDTHDKELQEFLRALRAKAAEMALALDRFVESRLTAAGSGSGAGAPSASGVEHRVEAASDAFDKVYARQTGLSPAAQQASLAQTGAIAQIEKMVRSGAIEERLARIKGERSSG